MEGSYFGEVDIFEERSRDCTVIVAPNSDCEVLLLSKKDLEIITNDFPHVGREMRITSIIRMKRNMKAK